MPRSSLHIQATAIVASLVIGLGASAPAAAQSEPAAPRECGGYPAPVIPDLTPTAAHDETASVETPFGAVELPLAPAAALGMYTTDVDMLVWLGYPLAASQPIRGDSGYETFPCFFPQGPLAGIDTFGNYPEYDYEEILSTGPDFILNGLGYDDDVNARLPQIAPTYSVNAFDGRSWREHFRETAEALDRIERYEAWVAVYEARLAEVRKAIAHNSDVVVAPLSFWGGKYSSSCYVGVECSVFADLGLTIYEPALADGGTGVELSPEEVGQLESVDYAFTGIGIGDQGLKEFSETMAEAGKNPLWSRLEFVQQQHIVPFEFEMVFGSPSGQLAFLEVVAKALSE